MALFYLMVFYFLMQLLNNENSLKRKAAGEPVNVLTKIEFGISVEFFFLLIILLCLQNTLIITDFEVLKYIKRKF